MSAPVKSTPLPGDNPIRDRGDDVLERSGRAAAFARQVLDLDASEGAAVGVFGPWGSGKTSFLNLTRKTFENKRVPVLDFNPWLFSGTEQLVERFFAELSASMGMKDELKEIGDALGKYGAALSAVAGVASALLAVPQIAEISKTWHRPGHLVRAKADDRLSRRAPAQREAGPGLTRGSPHRRASPHQAPLSPLSASPTLAQASVRPESSLLHSKRWECLIDLYGSGDVLKARINDLRARCETLTPWIETRGIPLDEAENLLELAVGYPTGSRPGED